VFYPLYATFPWVKRVYTRVGVYPTHVYVLKHLKKYKTPYFRAEIAGFTCWSPVSARGLTVPNQLLTKKLLWRWYKKTSKGRPKGGGERRGESKIIMLRFPLYQVWSPLCLLHFPHLHRKSLFPCVLVNIHPLCHHGVRPGRSSCWRLEAGTNPEGSFAWSLLKVTQVKSFRFMYFICHNRRNMSWFPISSFFMLMRFMFWILMQVVV